MRGPGGNGKLRHPARREMRHVVTVRHPPRRLAGITRNRHPRHRRHMHHIPHHPAQRNAVKRHHLKHRPLQMHRMSDHRHVVKRHRDPLAAPGRHRDMVAPHPPVNRPAVGLHPAPGIKVTVRSTGRQASGSSARSRPSWSRSRSKAGAATSVTPPIRATIAPAVAGMMPVRSRALPLRHRHAKPCTRQRGHRVTAHRNEPRRNPATVNPENGRRRCVDDPHPHGPQKRQRHVRYAVLDVRRHLPVPVNDRPLIEAFGQFNVEPLARIEDQPLPPLQFTSPKAVAARPLMSNTRVVARNPRNALCPSPVPDSDPAAANAVEAARKPRREKDCVMSEISIRPRRARISSDPPQRAFPAKYGSDELWRPLCRSEGCMDIALRNPFVRENSCKAQIGKHLPHLWLAAYTKAERGARRRQLTPVARAPNGRFPPGQVMHI